MKSYLYRSIAARTNYTPALFLGLDYVVAVERIGEWLLCVVKTLQITRWKLFNIEHCGLVPSPKISNLKPIRDAVFATDEISPLLFTESNLVNSFLGERMSLFEDRASHIFDKPH